MARAEALLARVGLGGQRDQLPATLSGGQRQRAALARTLMEDRPVVLMDEPFSALDAITRARLQALAAQLLAGRTVLLGDPRPAGGAPPRRPDSGHGRAAGAHRAADLPRRHAAARPARPDAAGPPGRAARRASPMRKTPPLEQPAPAPGAGRPAAALAGRRLADRRAALPAAAAIARRPGAARLGSAARRPRR